MHRNRIELPKRVTASGRRPIAGKRDGAGCSSPVQPVATPPKPRSIKVPARTHANAARMHVGETGPAPRRERRRTVSSTPRPTGKAAHGASTRIGRATPRGPAARGDQLPAVPDGYRPSESETYMSPLQLAYFRARLAAMRDSLENVLDTAIVQLRQGDGAYDVGDDADVAFTVAVRAVDVRGWARQRNLLGKVMAGLRRIDAREYGYCAETGEPIGLRRLEARPTATLCIDAQEWHEYARRGYAT